MVTSRLHCILICLGFLTSCATTQITGRPPLAINDVVQKDAKATVLFWWATQCPCVARYHSRIESLSARYSQLGVSFIAISSNSDDENRALEISKRNALKLPLLMDPSGALANQLGVRTTPTVVVVDSSGAVQYRGWIDNERVEQGSDRIPYLENALKDVLANKHVATATSPIFGCRITKRLR